MTISMQLEIEEALDKKYEDAKRTNDKMAPQSNWFLKDNPDWIEYKAMIKMIKLFGYDWDRDPDDTHTIFKKRG